MMASFGVGEILWSLLVGFLMFSYLIMLVTVITDLFDSYTRSVASSPVDRIGRAKELLDDGMNDATEFERLKRAALA